MEEINNEKKQILAHKGNTLVIANPGTGKTLLLAHKYANLIESGEKPNDILCLTFTKKAKVEMEERILKTLKNKNLKIDINDLNVFTFHSYALDSLEDEDVVSTNFLRYYIYRYFVDNEILNYSEFYILDKIVPKMETLIRYLKSFDIKPEDINLQEVKLNLEEYGKLTKEEMDKFAEYFLKTYEYYEQEKTNIDYADMLLKFKSLKKKPKFKYVLVDELQDVNIAETDIALESGDTFFTVGDKKQAIFGFQGGSIINFKKFKNSKEFILSENFRSTNEILQYAKEYFCSNTKDEVHKEDLKNLNNPNAEKGINPIIYSTENDVYETVGTLVNNMKGSEIAIITRTNYQIMDISKVLQKMGIEHTSTYFASSATAKNAIITFIRGIFSEDYNDIQNAMFTPFFPISLKDALNCNENILEICPKFKQMREEIKNLEDINMLFDKTILPISMAYGKEYLLAAMSLKNSFNEAIGFLKNKNLNNLIDYLKSSDLKGDESSNEKRIIVTTIHKSKGRQWEKVIYVPKKTKDNTNFQDIVVRTILNTKGIHAEEELDEEALRIDFVALTRAKKELYIIPEKPEKYLNDYCTLNTELKVESIDNTNSSEKLKKAYSLFVNGDLEESRKLLDEKQLWLLEYITKHFEDIKKMSFTTLNPNPINYLKYNILNQQEFSKATQTGSLVHKYAEQILKQEEPEIEEEVQPYTENVKTLIKEIKQDYPELVSTEEYFQIELKDLVETKEDILFTGKIDAVFKNNDKYLILDWKTNREMDKNSIHKRQLETYRNIYSKIHNIPLENIKVALGYIGLRPIVNLGKISCEICWTQPIKRSFNTTIGHIEQILTWKAYPPLFFEDLSTSKQQDPVVSALLEQYEIEKEN